MVKELIAKKKLILLLLIGIFSILFLYILITNITKGNNLFGLIKSTISPSNSAAASSDQLGPNNQGGTASPTNLIGQNNSPATTRVQPATTTITSSSTPVPAVNIKVSLEAKFYPNVLPQTRAGDMIGQTVIRDNPNIAMTNTNSKWISAINYLNAVTNKGVIKSLVFSSYQDLNNLLSEIPGDISTVRYNFEGIMMPSNEFNNLLNSVKQFASIAHSAGKKVTFASISSTFNTLIANGNMSQVAAEVDTLALQEQKYLPAQGVTNTVNNIKSIYNSLRSLNSNVGLIVQLWMGEGTYQQISDTFTQSKGYYTYAGLGTHNDLNGIQTVLHNLGR